MPLAPGSEPQASRRLPLHTQIKDREVRPRTPVEHRAVSRAQVPGDFSPSRPRHLGESAPATCLVSSPAACACSSIKVSLPSPGIRGLDRSFPRGVPRPAGERIAGRASERCGTSERRGPGEHREGAAAGTPRVTLCGATELGEHQKRSYTVEGLGCPHSGC